jgi:hypothetical protein
MNTRTDTPAPVARYGIIGLDPDLEYELAIIQDALEQVADAIRRCEEHITAPHNLIGELAVKEQDRAEALAARYLRIPAGDVSIERFDRDIAALRCNLEPLKARAAEAAAARPVLVARQARLQEQFHELIRKGMAMRKEPTAEPWALPA